MEKKIEDLKLEVDDLSKKNTNLQNSFSKFYTRQQKFNNMLKIEFSLTKMILKYDGSEKETHFKYFRSEGVV